MMSLNRPVHPQTWLYDPGMNMGVLKTIAGGLTIASLAACSPSTPPAPSTVTMTSTISASAAAQEQIDQQQADLDKRSSDLDARESAISTSEAVAASNTFSGDGTYLVGKEIEPGTWRSLGSGGCYWARLSSLDGGSSNIIDNDNASGPTIAQIGVSDIAFETKRCGTWTRID